MFDLATHILYYVKEEDFKEAEMNIFGLEFDHEPKTKLINIIKENKDESKKYFYTLKEEHNKWYFVT